MPCVGAVLSVVHLSIFRSGKGRIKDATVQLYQSLKGCSALCLCRTFLDYTEGDAAKHGDDDLGKKNLDFFTLCFSSYYNTCTFCFNE